MKVLFSISHPSISRWSSRPLRYSGRLYPASDKLEWHPASSPIPSRRGSRTTQRSTGVCKRPIPRCFSTMPIPTMRRRRRRPVVVPRMRIVMMAVRGRRRTVPAPAMVAIPITVIVVAAIMPAMVVTVLAIASATVVVVVIASEHCRRGQQGEGDKGTADHRFHSRSPGRSSHRGSPRPIDDSDARKTRLNAKSYVSKDSRKRSLTRQLMDSAVQEIDPGRNSSVSADGRSGRNSAVRRSGARASTLPPRTTSSRAALSRIAS